MELFERQSDDYGLFQVALLHRIRLKAPKFSFTQFHENRDYATGYKKYMTSQLKDRCI